MSASRGPHLSPFAINCRLPSRVDPATSTVGRSIDLDALPVFDGMSVADGRLYLACQDGSLRYFSGTGPAGANTKSAR